MTSFCIVFAALLALTIVALPAVLAGLVLETQRRRYSDDLDVPSSGSLAPVSLG